MRDKQYTVCEVLSTIKKNEINSQSAISIYVQINHKLNTRSNEKKQKNTELPSRKHARAMYTPYTPLLYNKTGVCRDILFFFLYFGPKPKIVGTRLNCLGDV